MQFKNRKFIHFLLAAMIAAGAVSGCSEKKSAEETVKDKLNDIAAETSKAIEDIQGQISTEASEAEKKSELVKSNKSNGEFTYDLYSDHVEVKKYEGSSVKLVVPAEIDDQPVTVVKGYEENGFGRAFTGSAVVEVQLPDTLTTIGKDAFYRSKVKTVNIPDSVKTIGLQAFRESSNLEGITLPKGLEAIGEYAFHDSLQAFGDKLVIPDGIEYIPKGAFSHTSYRNEKTIKELVLPDSVKYIENGAFSQLGLLEKITFGNSLIEIGDEAFSVSGSFISCTPLKELTIPSSVTKIGEYAFFFSGVESLTLPENVELSQYCFKGTKNLKKVVIPKGTVFKGTRIFEKSGLEEVEVYSERIPEYAFEGCSDLKTVILSSDVVSIEKGAFSVGNNTLSLHIPESVISMDDCIKKSFEFEKKVKIYGKKGSAAEKYAKEKGIEFIEE